MLVLVVTSGALHARASARWLGDMPTTLAFLAYQSFNLARHESIDNIGARLAVDAETDKFIDVRADLGGGREA